MISSEDLERSKFKWYSVDRIPKIGATPFIINTDLQSGPGIHWIAARRYGKKLFIVDSLGPNNYRQNDDVMFSQIRAQGLTPTFYDGKFQQGAKKKLGNKACGWYAQVSATILELSPTIKEANERLYTLFGRTAGDNDVDTLVDIIHNAR